LKRVLFFHLRYQFCYHFFDLFDRDYDLTGIMVSPFHCEKLYRNVPRCHNVELVQNYFDLSCSLL
jgi:hypothetical protein